MMLKIIDLFAGMGGIRIGFQQAMNELGIETECVYASEIKPYALKAYRDFFGHNEQIDGDITQIKSDDIPDFDFLLAGFPCQPFSSAGVRKGFADTRGTLFFEIERILKSKLLKGCPAKGFLLENVEGLINHDGGNTLSTIIKKLEDIGYEVNYKLIDSQFFGLPQSRKRVYIVGMLNEKISLDNFPVKSALLEDILEKGLPTVDSKFTKSLLENYSVEQLKGMSIKDKRGGRKNIHSWDIGLKGKTTEKERKLLELLLKERRKKHWAEEIGIVWMDGMPLTEKQIATFFDSPDLSEMLGRLTEMKYLTYEHPKKQVMSDDGTLSRVPDTTLEKGYNIVTGKLSFEFSKILDPKELAPTLVAMDVSRLGVADGNGIRRLSTRECLRLFGYPDSYSLDMLTEKEAFDLLGNTVCIPVIRAVAKRMGECLREEGHKNGFNGRADISKAV